MTDAALPVLREVIAAEKEVAAILYSMQWPAGVCSTQHHLEIGRPKATHQTIVVSGVPIAFESKYARFVDGTVIDFGTRGAEAGLMLTNPELDLYSIVHSEPDSALMTEMLGSGFKEYRDSVLRGTVILEPKSKLK